MESVPSIRLTFDKVGLGTLSIDAEDGSVKLIAHAGFAEEVAGYVYKMDSEYHALAEYLSENGLDDELDGVLVGYVRVFQVRPGARGMGLGGLVLEMAVAALREADVRRVFLHATPETKDRRESLERFYASHGFRDYSDYVSGSHTVMRRSLKRA